MAEKHQRTKGEHYIPRAAYLDHFADTSGKRSVLWVYPVDATGIRVDKEIAVTPKKLCKETYLYEAPNLPVNTVEQFLQTVEDAYNEVLREKVLKKMPLTDQEKGTVALFVSTLEARVPEMRDNLLQFLMDIEDKVEKLEEQFAEGRESETHGQIKEAKHRIFADQIIMAASINRWSRSSFLFLDISTFYDPNVGGFFITSDQPVTLYDFTLMNSLFGTSPMSPTAELVVPLTPSVALFANNRGLEGYEDVHPNFIMELSNRILVFSRGRIIAPHRLDTRTANRILKRHRQSFLLEYLSRKESEK